MTINSSSSGGQTLPAPQVQDFRRLLNEALNTVDEHGRKWSDTRWGCYAFYDYDGEPIYVGQTNERLRVRVRRHLTNQRTDAVAMRILDVFEVAELELWPLWEYQTTKRNDKAAKQRLDATEYSAHSQAVHQSRFHATLNEKLLPQSSQIALPPSRRFALISETTRVERGHPDIRIARRAETLSRLAAVAHERGEVSAGLRRALVVQAVRLAHLAASRFAQANGRPIPGAGLIDMEALLGSAVDQHQGQLEFEESDVLAD